MTAKKPKELIPTADPAPVAPVTNRISDVVWQALIAGVVTIVLGFMSYRNGNKADVAAVKVEEVRTTLQTSTAETDEKLDTIHGLVNSSFGVQLRLNATVTRRLANATKDPEDAKAADLAEELLREHDEKQKAADRVKAISQPK